MGIRYSTNWMGPCGMWWFRERNLVNEKNQITEYWYGGRIDVYGLPEDEYYNGRSEIGLPVMDGPSWAGFSQWLETLETDAVCPLDNLVELYERGNPKIRWADTEFKDLQ